MSTGWPPFRYRFSTNMIIKEKNSSTFKKWLKKRLLLKSGAVFQNSSRVEPFWLHFFFSVTWSMHFLQHIFLLLKSRKWATGPKYKDHELNGCCLLQEVHRAKYIKEYVAVSINICLWQDPMQGFAASSILYYLSPYP